MILNYTYVEGVSQDSFSLIKEKFYREEDLKDPTKFTKADESELNKIEKLLEIRPGLLEFLDDYTEYYKCGCGRVLTTYDAVLTSLVDAGHTKSFVLHTLVGVKKIITPAHKIRCSSCGSQSDRVLGYAGQDYECDLPPRDQS